MSGDRVVSSTGKFLEIDSVFELIVKWPNSLVLFKSLTISNADLF